MADVVAGLAVFGAVIAVGWLLVRTRAVSADADGVLTRVCFFAATPALLVTTLSRADLTAVLSRSTAVAVAAELTAIVSAWCLHRLVLRRPTAEATIGALASGYVNAANLGIPVAVLVLGDAATIAPILLLQLLVLTPATFTVLDAVTRRGNPSRLATLTLPLRNPLLWGVVAGTAANLGGVNLTEWGGGHPAQGLEMLGRVAVPLMMLALGMSLAGAPRPLRNPAPEEASPSPQDSPARTVQSVQSARRGKDRQGQEPPAAEAGSEAHAIDTAGGRPPRVEEEPAHGATSTSQRGADRHSGLWLAVGWKLAVMPGLAVVVGLAAGLSGGQLLAPVVTAALPTAQNVFMYASRYGAAKDLARDAVLLTTAGFVPVVLLAAALLH